jgi:RecB family exonuclease
LLVEAQWAVPDDLSGWTALLETNGTVLGVGFAGGDVGSGCGRLGAIEAHVLDTLGVARVEPATVDAIDAIAVTDVASEARTAAALIQGCTNALVLVADAETSQRVTATLRRNGMAVAEDGATALKDHALVSLLRRLLPCVESQGVEPVSAKDLIDYLTHPALSRRAIKRGTDSQEEQVEDMVDRSAVRDVRSLLRGTRRYHATVAEWVALVDAQLPQAKQEAAEESDEDIQDRKQRYVGTIQIVQGHLQALAEQVSLGTLGALATLISKRRLSSPHDRLGHAIQGALRSRSSSLANRENLDLALSGATGGVRVGDGATVLRYEEYDGRSSERLVLLDVHHKGLGKAPTISPLLKEADYKCMGLPTPTTAVDERMALARWAASRAATAHAVVTHMDATGRRVVPPVQLALQWIDAASALGGVEPARYGHALAIPESELRHHLVASAAGTADTIACAQQIAAEWVRAGYREAGIELPKMNEEPQTLLDYIELYDVRPKPLRPWLGQVGPAKGSDDGLPTNFRMSATRLEIFTNCMYVAWVERVLGIREPETLDEDVNARELGTATHAVLEAYVKEHTFQRVVPAAERDPRREHLASHCVSTTEDNVVQAREKRSAQDETPAAESARRGLTRRWQKHWQEYADGRIISSAAAAAKLSDALAKEVDKVMAREVVEEMCPALAKGPTGDITRLFLKCLTTEPTLDGLRTRMPQALEDKGVAKGNRTIVMDALSDDPPKSLQVLIDKVDSIWKPPPHPDGDGLLLDAELPFGKEGSAMLPLGRKPMDVNGFIDTIIEWKTTLNDPSLEIVDFKTGGPKSGGNSKEVSVWLTKPQLSFYALAIREGLVEGTGGRPVSALGYDMVRKDSFTIPVKKEFLDEAQRVYGALVDRARDGDFVPIPHPQWSPYPGGHQTDIVDALRIRPDSLPDHAQDEEDES